MYSTRIIVQNILFAIILLEVDCNKVIPGTVTPFLNQSSEGVYRFKGGRVDGVEFYSYWYQNDVTKQLAIGIGERGKDLQAHFWFFQNTAFELKPKDSKDQSKGYECVQFVDFNYTMEIGGYDKRYLQSMGQFFMHEKNENFTAELFMGQALDGVGPLNVVAAIDQRDGTYAKMFTVQSIGFAAYSEYYLYPRNDSLPDPRHFVLPTECQPASKPREVYFFHIFNMQGKHIDQPKCPAGCKSSAIELSFHWAIFISASVATIFI